MFRERRAGWVLCSRRSVDQFHLALPVQEVFTVWARQKGKTEGLQNEKAERQGARGWGENYRVGFLREIPLPAP